MLSLTGYKILETTTEDDRFILLKGVREADNLDVFVRLLKSDYPEPEKINRFETAFQIAKELQLKGLLAPMALETVGYNKAAILEFFPGPSLKQLIRSGMMEVRPFLRIALKIAGIIEQIHQADIVYNGVNAFNILVDPTTEQVRIIDLAPAIFRADKEYEHNVAQEIGILVYSSPEATGRLNRSIDNRSDLYSLGVLFYEMLTGQPPFDYADPMELVHAHIAKEPSPPETYAETPKAVSDIILKLLSKNPEDRYQRIQTLLKDLTACRRQIEHIGFIKDFKVAEKDTSGLFQYPSKLYGREEELAMIEQSLADAIKGNLVNLFITGPPGSGKTALGNEIRKRTLERDGYFLSGNFDYLKRHMPFQVIPQIFGDLADQIMTKPRREIDRIQEALRDQPLISEGVATFLVPEWRDVIRPKKESDIQKAADPFDRMEDKFKVTLNIFATEEHPWVVFLDDFQWADAAIINFIQKVVKVSDTRHFLYVYAFRDHELDQRHPAALLMNDLISNPNCRTRRASLQPLKKSDILDLLTDLTQRPKTDAEPLADLIKQKTDGNPFFMRRFVEALYNEGLLYFDEIPEKWEWDLVEARKMDVSDNVAQLLISQFNTLQKETRLMLEESACIGVETKLSTLANVTGKNSFEAKALLKPAEKSQLLVFAMDSDNEGDLLCRFSHNQIQQIIYSRIGAEQKERIHLKIGKYLLEKMTLDESLAGFLNIVDHLNLGRKHITELEERINLAALNLQAIKKTIEAVSYERADHYATIAMELLPPNHWRDHYDLSLSIFKERAMLKVHLEGIAKLPLLEEALTFARKKNHKVELYLRLTQVSHANRDYEKAYAYMMQMLSFAGALIPKTDDELDELMEKEETLFNRNMRRITLSTFLNAPTLAESEYISIVSMAIGGGLAMLTATIRLKMYDYLNLHIFNLMCEQGVNEFSAPIFTYAAVFLARLERFDESFVLDKIAEELALKYDHPFASAKTKYLRAAYIQIYNDHWLSAIENVGEAFSMFFNQYDCVWATNSYNMWFFLQLISGVNLSALYKKFQEVVKKLQDQFRHQNQNWDQHVVIQSVRNLLGLTDNKFTLNNPDFDESIFLKKFESNPPHRAMLFQEKIRIAYLFRDHDAGLDLGRRYFKIYSAASLQLTHPPEPLFYCALIFLSAYNDLIDSEKAEFDGKIDYIHCKMKKWAAVCPTNYLPRLALIEAELARIQGRETDAMRLYDKAAEAARKYQYINIEAIVNEAAARYCLSLGFIRIADSYLKEAYYLYGLWGAVAKLKDLEDNFPQFFVTTAGGKVPSEETSKELYASTPIFPGTFSSRLDLNTILKAAQAISGEIIQEKLIVKLLKIMIENAGAQRGALLLLNKNGDLNIKAEGFADTGRVEKVIVPESEIFEKVPERIVTWVARTGKTIVVDDAFHNESYVGDPYIQKNRTRSALCIPVVHTKRIFATLYFENNLCAGAFTADRQEVLGILSSQAAISLENAELFEKSVQAEKDMDRLRNELKNIIDSMPSMLVQVDRESSVVQINNEAARSIDIQVKEILGRPFHEAFPKLAGVADNIQRAIREGATVTGERMKTNADGKVQYLDAAIFPLIANGAKGAVIRIDDVTEKVRMEEILIQSEKMLSVGGLAAGMAHEINNPLAGIVQNAQVIMNRLSPESEANRKVAAESGTTIEAVAEYMKRRGLFSSLTGVMESGKRAALIVQNMLSFSRQGNLSRANHRMDKLLDSVVEIAANDYDLKKKYDFRNIVIEREYDEAVPPVLCEGAKIQQVFLNILKNGAQAMMSPENKNFPHRFIFRIRRCQDFVRIEIEDNGPGIDETVRKRMFEPFFTTKDVGEGTGLGLSVSYFIITEHHKGGMQVESSPGKGTIFIISLPV